MHDWGETFVALLVSHRVGDYLLQTDWQACHKRGGLGRDPIARRALGNHILTYTTAFVPALVWLSASVEAWTLLLAALIAIPHLVQDDGRLLAGYIKRVKRLRGTPTPELFGLVDQSFHLLALFGVALLASALR